jgi:hypothetical protein
MGRPIKKQFFGGVNSPNVNPPETSNALSFGIRMLAYLPAVGTLGYISGTGGTEYLTSTIVRQVGSTKYVVTNAEGVGRVRLTSDATPGEGFAYLVGYIAGSGDTANESTSGGTAVALKKLTARRAYDFSGNIYTWSAQNDSTEDYIELTMLKAAD